MAKQKAHVSELKKKLVENFSNLIKNKKTLLVASIKDIPASQFQEIGKKLRGKAMIKVPKKNLIFRALDSIDNEELKKLKERISENFAILFSDLDSFELASELIEKKQPAKAKAGQEAPEDIIIPAGLTDLVPGPAISELGALGIKIQIEGGKINIKEPKVIVKEGEKISENAAAMMNKLDIKPFEIGFVPIAAFDAREGKVYLNIKIDKEETLQKLKEAFAKSLGFAVEIGYISNDTIVFLLQKAERNAKVLEKFGVKISEKKSDDKKSDNQEENTDNVEQDVQEDKSAESQSDLDNKGIDNQKKTLSDESSVNNSNQSHEPVNEQIKSEQNASDENTQPENKNQEEFK